MPKAVAPNAAVLPEPGPCVANEVAISAAPKSIVPIPPAEYFAMRD